MAQDYKRTYQKRRPDTDNIASAASELGHVPPQAIDIEEGVLGAMIVDSDYVSDAIEMLKPKSFYDPKFRLIFETIVELHSEREPVDMLTVSERLRRNGNLDAVGGAVKVASLAEKVGSAAHIEYYIKILQQKTIQRDLIDAAYGILRDSFDEGVNVDNLIETSQSRVFNAVQGNIKSEYKQIGDIVNRSLERIQEIQNSNGLTGIASGFPSLDKFTMGWQKSNLIILGARPSVGKTAFSLNLARNAAVDFNVPTAYFSLEMSDMELADRLISSESGITADKIKGLGKMEPYEWVQLEQTITKLVKAPLYIDETPGLTITEFTSKARRLVREKNVQIIFVDYLQLMHASSQQQAYREQEVSAISQALKATAKELHIPIIALSQLNRNLMNRQASNGRPVLSDLRDSGSIEQDADMVLFIHRPGMLGLDEDLTKAEVIIAKHRNGKVGTIDMTFSGDQVKFIDMANSLPSFASASLESEMNSGRPQKEGGGRREFRNSPRSDVPYDPFNMPVSSEFDGQHF